MTTANASANPKHELGEAYFGSFDGLQLYMASIVPPSPRGVALVLHGYADHGLRYRHVLEALADAGFAAHALDYRGHGRAAGRRGYVQNFSDYLADARTAIDRIKGLHPNVPLFLVCHSHGALVGCSLMARTDAPNIAGVVLSSPYFRLKLVPSSFQLFQAKVVGRVLPFISVKNPITTDMLTKDAGMIAWTEADQLRHHVVTPRWFAESNAAQEALFRNAPQFKTPLLAMQGADDPLADPTGAADFVKAAGSADKHLTVYPGMLHEIFNEVERAKPISEAVAWIEARLGGAK